MKRHSLSPDTFAFLILLTFCGCRAGGDVTVNPNSGAATSTLSSFAVPSIAVPATSPYYSNNTLLNIGGICIDGDTILLSGDSVQQQTCSNSTYSFKVPKQTDGIYFFSLTQEDPSSNISPSVPLIWILERSVPLPLISSPNVSPFLSAQSALPISGSCQTGTTISVSGDATASTSCVNSSFSLSIPENVDRTYNLLITQTDQAGNTASVPLVWQKHILQSTPSAPTLQVTASQVFTIVGGTPPYTLTMTTNNSMGTLDAATDTYTVGQVARQTDVLQIRDSLNTILNVNINSIAAAPDHFIISSGASQNGTVGTLFGLPATVAVVDQYNNGILNYPVFIEVTEGDLQLTTSFMQSSNAQGLVHASIRAGYSSLHNTIQFSPLTGTLPDLAHSGNPTITLTETVTSTGTGTMGNAFATGNFPGAVISADLRGIGKVDAAVVNQSDNTIGIFLGQGKGLFAPMVPYRTCTGPVALANGDFNGDGIQDIAVLCSNSSVTLLLGNPDPQHAGKGLGTFSLAPSISGVAYTTFSTLATLPGPTSIVVADFNHDGKADLAIASGSNNTIGIYLGNGDAGATFAAPVIYPVGAGPNAMVASDLKHNGNQDLVVITAEDSPPGLNVLMNNGNGTFQSNVQFPMSTLTTPVALAAGDLNGDGYPDVVVLDQNSDTVSIFLNDQTGSFPAVSSLSVAVGNSPASVTLADLNGDSKLDVVVSNSGDNTVGYALGNGDGTFGTESILLTVSAPSSVAVASFSGNQLPDLLVSCSGGNSLQLFPSNATPSLHYGYVTPAGVGPGRGVSADFDGDGIPDLAVINPGTSTITILKGLGNGTFEPMPVPSPYVTSTLNTGGDPVAIQAADFNNDGFIDLVVVEHTSNSVGVFLGNGNGTFQARAAYSVGSHPSAVAVADFNHDGFLDLAVANQASGTVTILKGIGDGTFTQVVESSPILTGISSSSSPINIVAADFNGDSLMDLAVLNQTDQTVSVLLGNGDFTFQPHVDYPVGNGPIALAAGDFQNNGVIDLLVSNLTDQTVSVLLGYGNGSFQTQTTVNGGSTPGDIVVGDFNGDGKLDFAVVNGISDTFTLLYGNNNGTFGNAVSVGTNGTGNSLILGDFNGDGALDIGITDGTNNQVQVFLGQ